jgi:hypothetical protein
MVQQDALLGYGAKNSRYTGHRNKGPVRPALRCFILQVATASSHMSPSSLGKLGAHMDSRDNIEKGDVEPNQQEHVDGAST